MSLNSDKSPYLLLFSLFTHVSKGTKRRIYLLIISSLICGLFEITNLIFFKPLISSFSDSYDDSNPLINAIISNTLISRSEYAFFISAAICFTLSIFMSTFFRLFNLKLMVNLTSSIGNQISRKVFRNTLYQPYSVFLNRNSSEVLSVLTKHLHITISSLNRLATFSTSLAISVALFIGLLITSFQISLLSILFFGIFYLIIFNFSKKRLLNNSKLIKKSSALHYQKIVEALGNIRDIIVYDMHEVQLREYNEIDRRLRIAEAGNVFLVGFPRFTIETCGIILLIIFSAIFLLSGFSQSYLFGVIGTLALASQRLLPSLQQIYTSISVIKGNTYSIGEVVSYLNQDIKKIKFNSLKSKLLFENEIVLKNISFGYKSNSEAVLKELNLTIKKNAHIGLVGGTGSGKSTLIDIFMMLLQPQSGKMLIDGRNLIGDKESQNIWRKKISYIPQSIFLNDSSIEQNITLQQKDLIDYKKLSEIIKVTQLSNFIDSLEFGLSTNVGERGIRLSGGQRQRIGIARALYRKSQILILDEATSALDNITETLLIKNLYAFSKEITTITIAHKIDTLKTCDSWFVLNNGKLKKIDSFQSLLKMYR